MRQDRPLFLRYGSMIIAVGLAFGLTSLVPQLRERESFVIFFGAISISAWYGGRGPGIIACVLSAVLTNYFLYTPQYTFTLEIEAVVPVVVFMLVGFMVSSVTSELAAAEERMNQQRQWLQVTLSSISDAVIACDGNGCITFLNPAAEALSKTMAAAAHGKAFHKTFALSHSPLKEESEQPLEILPLRPQPYSVPGDLFLVTENSSRIPVELSASPIKDSHSGVLGVVVVLRDIRERHDTRHKIMQYQQRLQSLASELALAEERARRQLATGLHDRVGQTLALSRIKLQTLREGVSDEGTRETIDDITDLMKDMMEETRSLTFELSPPILYEFGLEPALEWLCGHFQKNHGIAVEFIESIKDGTLALKQDIRIVFFQAARELLTNVVKHAKARHAKVEVHRTESRIALTVEDDGKGLNVDPVPSTAGFGLFNIRERLQQLGGTCAIQTQNKQGTTVLLTLRLEA